MARRSRLQDWERRELNNVLAGKSVRFPGHGFFRPADISYLPLNFDNEASLFRLPDEQIGAVMRRLFEYCHGYLSTFDAALLPDDSGLSDGAAMILSVLAGYARRQYDIDRVIAFSRTTAGKMILETLRTEERGNDVDEE